MNDPPCGLIGYSRADVDQLIGDATDAYETVWRSAPTWTTACITSRRSCSRVDETEEALRNALITAEKVADERRAQASRDAELVVREAEVRAREILHGAYAERERIRQETAQLRGQGSRVPAAAAIASRNQRSRSCAITKKISCTSGTGGSRD